MQDEIQIRLTFWPCSSLTSLEKEKIVASRFDEGYWMGVIFVQFFSFSAVAALIKKKRKFSSYIRKFRVEQLQSHI
jgi:hypothetical protein